jgi:hypothetical protein
MTDTPPTPLTPEQLDDVRHGAGPALPALPTEVPVRQLVADLAASLRATAQELGAVLEHLARAGEQLTRRAEQHAQLAATWLERGDYSAAAAECHRAHQARLQAAALDTVRSVVQP